MKKKLNFFQPPFLLFPSKRIKNNKIYTLLVRMKMYVEKFLRAIVAMCVILQREFIILCSKVVSFAELGQLKRLKCFHTQTCTYKGKNFSTIPNLREFFTHHIRLSTMANTHIIKTIFAILNSLVIQLVRLLYFY